MNLYCQALTQTPCSHYSWLIMCVMRITLQSTVLPRKCANLLHPIQTFNNKVYTVLVTLICPCTHPLQINQKLKNLIRTFSVLL